MQRLVDGSKENRSAADQGPLHTHFNVRGYLQGSENGRVVTIEKGCKGA